MSHVTSHCTVTLTVLLCESVPDWAVMMIEAVPRFVEVPLLLYPPQPPRATDNENIANTQAVAKRDARAI